MKAILRQWRTLTPSHFFRAAACGFFVILLTFTENSFVVVYMSRLSLLVFLGLFAFWGMVFLVAITTADALGSGQWLRYVVACGVAAAICATIHWALRSAPYFPIDTSRASGFLVWYSAFFMTLFPGVIVSLLYVRVRDARDAHRGLMRLQEAASDMQRKASSLEMQIASGSIDPDLVARSLREIRELYENDRALAHARLDALAADLRAAIPHAG